MSHITLATRNWGHVLPIALGDVSVPGVALERRDTTPVLWTETTLDGGETSFSKYVRARAAGDYSVTALPIFVMTGFRHRCVITRRDSALESMNDLCGTRVGITGWPDSGNVWTRSLVRDAGIDIDDIDWYLGRLTDAHRIEDRTGGVSLPPVVSTLDGDEPMTQALARGALDAVMTPFMPPRFYRSTSPFRTVVRDSQRAEQDYLDRRGYVPGIHLLALRTELLERDPGLAGRLQRLFDESKRISHDRHWKLQDLTPWSNRAIADTEAQFDADWMPYGFTETRPMVEAFLRELRGQRLLDDRSLSAADLFPFSLDVDQESVP